MKKQSFGHIIVFLVISLFSYIYSISPSLTKAKVVVTEKREMGENLDVGIKLCPSFWFDNNQRENTEIKELFRTHLLGFIEKKQENSKLIPPPFWQVETINLDSEVMLKENYQADGRCRDLSVHLIKSARPTSAPPQSREEIISQFFQDKKILRIGLRDKQGFISQFNPKSKQWNGAAIEFGHLIAKKAGKTPRFTRLKSLDSRFFALRYGVVDLTISLISHSPEREERAYLSTPYYTTGLVMGAFSQSEGELIRSQQELNSNHQTIVAVEGSSSIDYIQNHYPKANIVTVESSSGIPGYTRELMADPRRKEVFFITDELIARRWPGNRLVQVEGKKLLTNNDSYVVASGDELLVQQVNKVIESGVVTPLYGTSQQ
jgi:ABC-type amino acid transport substrate-binding protein